MTGPSPLVISSGDPNPMDVEADEVLGSSSSRATNADPADVNRPLASTHTVCERTRRISNYTDH